MNRTPGLKTILALGLIGAAGLAQAGVAREDILVLAEDGKHYTAYKTLRSELPGRQVFLDAGESAGDLLYFHPDDYRADKSDDKTLLKFDGGSYALMRASAFDEQELKRTDDKTYKFTSWNGKKQANGHYGKWNDPDPFERFSYVWVVPGNIDILTYAANKKGEWTLRGNTLAWSGKNVNDLTFSVSYRVRPSSVSLDLTQVAEPSGEDGLTRITLESGSLFPSGSANFTPAGEALLTELAATLGERDPAKVIVEGHTDNQKLKPYLRERFPSNWELSAARATTVVRWFADNGIPADILEARAYGEQKPVADNSSAEGRARNRRIAILVEDKAGELQESSENPKPVTPGNTE